MRRVPMLVVLLVGACRPEAYGRRVEVHVPPEDIAPLPPRSRPQPDFEVEVPPGTTPRVLRPHPTVEVRVPASQVLPRGMYTTTE